ncbi:unnamed protein product [Choristocarpus tenellus]
MMMPDEATIQDFKVTDNCFVHCVVTEAPSRLQMPSPPSDAPQDDEDEEDDDPSTRRGFDTLRASGMSRLAVTALRAYFSAEVREFAASSPPPQREGESDWDRQMESEERWMATQGATSEFAINVRGAQRGGAGGGMLGSGVGMFRGGGRLLGLEGVSEDEDGAGGNARDFMFGFVMGSFLGVIMLLWMWEGSVPRRQKLGILAGVTFQLGIKLMKFVQVKEPEDTE